MFFSGFFLFSILLCIFLGFSSEKHNGFPKLQRQIPYSAASFPKSRAFGTRRLFVVNAMLLSFFLEMHGYLYEF